MIADPIRIGADVWVGRGCAILSGVTIGDGAVIAANSVVTRDIPSRAIAVGAPAKPIRSRLAS
jgi:acetyltransferase-like isoleucine patch superfamily enzyme